MSVYFKLLRTTHILRMIYSGPSQWTFYIGSVWFNCVNKMTDSIAIDDDIILVWNKFPTSIRNDPCLSVFREEFEGAHGNSLDRYFHWLYWIFVCNFRFFYAAETFTAQNELLKPQIVGETKDSADRTGQSKFSIAKQIAFALIWAFVAWHLLTVKEKNLPKRDIVLNSNQTKSKCDFQMPFQLHLFNLTFITPRFQLSLWWFWFED